MFGLLLILEFGTPEVHAGQVGIRTIGVESYDAIFVKARKIDRTVTQAERNVRQAKLGFNQVMGLTKKSTYVEGIAELQRRAGKSISMSFRGQTPQVSSSKYLPAKVKQGVNALNNVLTNHVGALKRLSKVPKQTVALTKEVRNFGNQFQNGMDQMPLSALTNVQKAKTIRRNVRRMSNLPERTKRIVQKITNQLKNICAAFGQTWKERK